MEINGNEKWNQIENRTKIELNGINEERNSKTNNE